MTNLSEVELTLEEFKAIQKWQGWTDEEAQRWLDDQEPLPKVRAPPWAFRGINRSSGRKGGT